jgi:hypothetical protein
MAYTLRARFLCAQLVIATCAHAQPVVQWQQLLGGTHGEWLGNLRMTPEGGIVIAGWTYSNDGDVTGNHGSYDAWVVKLDSVGTMQWQRALGGAADDRALFVLPTADGGYIMAGYTNSNDGDISGNHGGKDAWLVKLDNAGNTQWQELLGGSGDDWVSSVVQTDDGGYLLVGGSASNDGDFSGNHGGKDVWVAQLDNAGTVQWQQLLGGTGDESATSLGTVANGSFMITGSTFSNNGDVLLNHGAEDAWVIKMDGTGTMEWQKTMGGTGNDRANALCLTTDGGMIMAGETSSNNGDVFGNHGALDAWVVKMDAAGAIIWQQALGGVQGDGASAIVQTGDGGYLMGGHAISNNGNVAGNHGLDDLWLVKLTSFGIIQWQHAMGGTGVDAARTLLPTADGGFLLGGTTSSNDGDVTGNHGYFDIWLIKSAPEGIGINELSGRDRVLHPNPTTGPVYLKWTRGRIPSTVQLIDADGRILKRVDVNQDTLQLDLDLLASGIYYVNMRFTDGTQVTNLVVKE